MARFTTNIAGAAPPRSVAMPCDDIAPAIADHTALDRDREAAQQFDDGRDVACWGACGNASRRVPARSAAANALRPDITQQGYFTAILGRKFFHRNPDMQYQTRKSRTKTLSNSTPIPLLQRRAYGTAALPPL